MSEFLDKLESKIDAIDEKERKKIIKSCQVEIEEKMEKGKTEEEAIKELGDIDELAKNICKSYHVNLVNRKKTFREKMNDGINMGAKFLAEAAQDTVEYTKENTKDKFLVAFFEIMLKIVAIVILIMILKVPFLILQMGIDFVLDLLFYPFNTTLSEIFKYIISVLYMAVCIASSIYMFKGYFDKGILTNINEENDEKIDKQKKEITKKNLNYALVIIKILLMIIIVIPMIFLNLAFLALTVLAIFLVFKGVQIVGLTIILLGFFLLTVTMITYVTEAIDNKYRNHFFALCISVISLIIGIVLFVDDLMAYKYPKTLDDTHFKTLTETVNIELEKETSFIFEKGEVEYIIDENIANNNVLMEITYYDDFIDIGIGRYFGEEQNRIILSPQDDNFDVSDYVYMYENIIKDLKDNNIFRYGDLEKYKVKVYYNEKTKELVK